MSQSNESESFQAEQPQKVEEEGKTALSGQPRIAMESSLKIQLGSINFALEICQTLDTSFRSLVAKSPKFTYLVEALFRIRFGEESLGAVCFQGVMPYCVPSSGLRTTTPIPNVANNWRHITHLLKMLDRILRASIYELQDVFQVQLSNESRQLLLDTRFPMLMKVFEELFDKTKDLLPPVSRIEEKPAAVSSQGRSSFNYRERLDGDTGHFRLLVILPGSKNDPICCKLRVTDLNTESPPEALSYVWGTQMASAPATVDGQPFELTWNLEAALRGLRLAKAERTIWVDAICINQSDDAEKSAQVKLMDRIYSSTMETAIWLGEAPRKPQQSSSLDTADVCDDYDLLKLLQSAQVFPPGSGWLRERITHTNRLFRYLRCLFDEEWWKRVWTIQEASLPTRHPTIYYCGRSFCWSQLQSALDFATLALKDAKQGAQSLDSELVDLLTDTVSIGFGIQLSTGLVPVALRRSRAADDQRYASSSCEKVTILLRSSANYMATNIRDKVFSLRGLLPKAMMPLLQADYSLIPESVFKRATALAMDEDEGMCLYLHFDLLRTSSSGLPLPSWVLNLSKGMAIGEAFGLGKESREVWTLLGAISQGDIGMDEDGQGNEKLRPAAATPSYLVCRGCFIDRVEAVGTVPDLADMLRSHSEARLARFFATVDQLRKEVLAKSVGDKNSRGPNSSNGARDEVRKASASSPLSNTFTLGSSSTAAEHARFQVYMEEVSKQYYFVTSEGLVGIGSSPFKVGDTLVGLRGCRIPFILRTVQAEAASEYTLVSSVFVGGIMEKELKPSFEGGVFPLRTFIIR